MNRKIDISFEIVGYIKKFLSCSILKIKLMKVGSVIGMIAMTLLIIVDAINTFMLVPPFPAIDVINLE